MDLFVLSVQLQSDALFNKHLFQSMSVIPSSTTLIGVAFYKTGSFKDLLVYLIYGHTTSSVDSSRWWESW